MNADKRAFHQRFFFNLEASVNGTSTKFKVPAGKRFAIEQVSGGANLPDGQRLRYYIVTTTVNDASASYFFDPANNPKFSINQRVRIYADPETDVDLFADRDRADGTAQVFITVSGYFVDFP